MLAKLLVLLQLCSVAYSSSDGDQAIDVTKPIWPFAYDWGKFPAAWFGGNATDFESEAQLEEIGKYSLAILGWQHLIFKTNWTAAVYFQIEQARLIKAKFPKMPVYIYTGFGNADFYNNATWKIAEATMKGCSNNQPCRVTPPPYTDWFLQSTNTPVYSMSACEQMGLGYQHPPTDKCANLIWNVGNPDMRDFYIDQIIGPLAAAKDVDGVFFDCFNFAYDMPSPWNRKATNIQNCTHDQGGPGCSVLLDGTVDLAARTAKALNAAGKVPMFSNPASFANGDPTGHSPKNKPAPIWLNESKLVAALSGSVWQLNYEFMRAEDIAATGQLQNMLEESRLGLAAGVHVYYTHLNASDPKSALEDPSPHIAVFMLMRQEYWYYFGSTGWLDGDWKWSKLYDALDACGAPTDATAMGGPNVYTRRYDGCTVTVDCTVRTACNASIVGANGKLLK